MLLCLRAHRRCPQIGDAARDAGTPAAPVSPNGRAPLGRAPGVLEDVAWRRKHEVWSRMSRWWEHPIALHRRPHGAHGDVACGGHVSAFAEPDCYCRRPAFEPSAPDPARKLYERASDALHAAHQLAVASGTPGPAAAVVPALASTDASLDALACAIDAMCRERVSAPSSSVACGRFGDRAVVVHERFAVASDAIHAARRAISASRETVGSPSPNQ